MLSLQDLDLTIDWANPVNVSHALNRGLIFWAQAVPDHHGFGSRTWFDLVRGRRGTSGGFDGDEWKVGQHLLRGSYGALSLDGANDYIYWPNIVPAKITEFTLVAKVNLQSSGGNQGIIALYDSALPSARSNMALYGSGAVLRYWDNNNGWMSYAGAYTYGTQLHVIVTVKSGGENKLYHNGIQVDSRTLGSTDGKNSVAIGASNNGGGEYAKGLLDGFRVYNRLLSAAEAMALYQEDLAGYPNLFNRAIPSGTRVILPSSSSYTLDAQSSSYAYSGSAASFSALFSAGVGSYTYSAANTSFGISLTSSTAGYAWTANDATLTLSSGYSLAADTADYAYTAQSAGLSISLSATAAAFSLTANSAIFAASIVSGSSGYSYTANDATLIANVSFTLDAQTAGYAYTASSAGLLWSEATQRTVIVGKARKAKRFVVEIDGQDFIVDSVEAAISLLDQAKEQSKEIDLSPVVKEAIRVRKGVEVKAPTIRSKTPDKRLQLAIKETRVDIQKLYQTIAENLELKIRLEMEIAERDDEESLAMLL